MDKSEIIDIAKRVSLSIMNGSFDLSRSNASDTLIAAAAFGLKDITDGRPVVIDDEIAGNLSTILDEAGVSRKAVGLNTASIIDWDPTYEVLKVRFSRPVKIRCMKPNDGIIFQIMPGVDGVDVPVDVMTICLDDEFHIDDLYAEAKDNSGIIMAVDDPSVDASSARVELQDYMIFRQQDLGMFLNGLKISAITRMDGSVISDDLKKLNREDFDRLGKISDDGQYGD